MLKKLLIAVVVMMMATSAIAATEYAIDPNHVYVGFGLTHFGVSNMVCTFDDVAGTIMYDADDLSKSSVEVIIQVNSLASGAADRVEHAKGENFLNAAEYPVITFKSTAVRTHGDGHEITGNLTVHGVTKEVTFPFMMKGPLSDPWGNPRIGISANLVIDRQEYGIAFDRTLKSGEPMLSNEVTIWMSLEALPLATDGEGGE